MKRLNTWVMIASLALASPVTAEAFTVSETQTRLVDFQPGIYAIKAKAFNKVSRNPDTQELRQKLSSQRDLLGSLIKEAGFQKVSIKPAQEPVVESFFSRIPSVEPSPYIHLAQISQILEIHGAELHPEDIDALIQAANQQDTSATQVSVWGDAYSVDASKSLMGDFITFRTLSLRAFNYPDEMPDRQREVYQSIQTEMLEELRQKIQQKCISFSNSLAISRECEIADATFVIDEVFDVAPEPNDGLNKVTIKLTATWDFDQSLSQLD